MKYDNSLWRLSLAMAIITLGFAVWYLVLHSILFGAVFGGFLNPNSLGINWQPLKNAANWVASNPIKTAMMLLPLVGYWFFFKISLAVSFLTFRSHIINEYEKERIPEPGSPLEQVQRRFLSTNIR